MDKTWTTGALIDAALAKSDDEDDEGTYWTAVGLLQYRGTRGVFNAAADLCQSQTADTRCLGICVLGQLGIPERTFPEECEALLLTLLEKEQDLDALVSIGYSLGHLRSKKGITPLSQLKTHPDEDVRYAGHISTSKEKLRSPNFCGLYMANETRLRNN